MSQFVATGFGLHFFQDILNFFKTGNDSVDMALTLLGCLLLNREWRIYMISYVSTFVSTFHIPCMKQKNRVVLNSVRKQTYEGSYNVCHEKIISICYFIYDRIQRGDLDMSQVRFFQEYVINTNDGYCEDTSVMVPIGSITVDTITVECDLNQKEETDDKSKRTEYKSIELNVVGDTYHDIEQFIDRCIREHEEKENLISNESIRWFRLRKIHDGSAPLVYFSKPLEHSASFSNLFFENKSGLLNMLDDLSQGKRSRLCLLLHGPPGTGKDSVVVAITKYLSEQSQSKRHIVAYPLDLFTKADDFMRIFYGNDILDGKHVPNHCQVRLFPEIEKYSDIILKKDIKDIIKQKSNPEEAQEDVYTYIQKNSPVEISKDDYQLLSMIKTVQKTANKTLPGMKLAPIIESLNSFMDQKQTLVIFTTNLPLECIDDVLIRQERLEPFYLGPPSKDTVYDILNLYYKDIPRSVSLDSLPIGKLMPSTITSCCKQCDTYQDCVSMLSQ